MQRHLVSVAVAAALLSWLCERAVAHDIKGAIHERIAGLSQAHRAALAKTPVADAETRSVLYNLFLWPVPRRLTICFWSGSPQLRKRVTESMRKMWPLAELTDKRLTYDAATFDNPPTCAAQPRQDIRVDFRKGDGYWSWPGAISLKHARSMNLQGFTETSPQQVEFDHLVAHEMGHALGLGHEHQSPAAPNCEWNFDYIRENYAWESEDQMMAQFEKFEDFVYQNKRVYVFSNYDKLSVMHYSFPKGAFRRGERDPCFIAQNDVPSDQDKLALQVAYGPSLRDIQARTRSAAPNLLAGFAGAEFAPLREALQFKAGLPDN